MPRRKSSTTCFLNSDTHDSSMFCRAWIALRMLERTFSVEPFSCNASFPFQIKLQLIVSTVGTSSGTLTIQSVQIQEVHMYTHFNVSFTFGEKSNILRWPSILRTLLACCHGFLPPRHKQLKWQSNR